MKKLKDRAAALRTALCTALLCAALPCALGGCAAAKPQDGVYTARFRHPSSGYVEFLTVTFRDGVPVDARFDACLADDPQSRKSQTTPQDYPMDPHPSAWMPQLAQNVLTAGTNPDKVASVAGATASSRRVRQLYNALLQAAADGGPSELILENEPDPANPPGAAGGSAGDTGAGADAAGAAAAGPAANDMLAGGANVAGGAAGPAGSGSNAGTAAAG